jgi:putative DNA primase/helicase
MSFLEKKGVRVSSRLVRSVESLVSWKAFSKQHTWNVGGTEVLNCKNGEVHLINGQWELQTAKREHYRTTQLPVQFDPKATAPRFTKFLEEIFEGDDDRQAKVQSLLELGGYSLMSHCRRERFVVLVGGGRNGKSVFLEVLEALAGRENRAAVAPENFDNKFQVAYLDGKLINLVGEIREGAVIPDAELKAITSGEPRTAEFKGQNAFTFKPFSTCWFGTNHMPHTRDFSEAMFQRAMIFTFNNMFIHDEDRIAKDARVYMADVSLKDDLMKEMPGILNMMLSAYAGVVERGFFTECASSKEAKKAWSIEADQAAQFFNDCCIEDITRWLPVGSVFYAYTNWARENGIKKSLTKRTLVSRLERLGYKKVRRRDKATGSVCVGVGGLVFNGQTKQWYNGGDRNTDDVWEDF